MKRAIFLFFLILGFHCLPAFALDIPEKPQSYVNDYASLLSSSEKQTLESVLSQFEKETSNQVVVAIFTSLEGQSLEDFSIHLAEKWKVGVKEHDNGAILLIFKEDRAVRIEVGYGLEGALPDAIAKRIIQNEIVPEFRQGNFDSGVSKAVNAILLATRGEYKAADSVDEKMQKWGGWFFWGMVFYFLIPLIFYAGLVFFSVQFLGLFPGLVLGICLSLFFEALRRIFSGAASGMTYSRRGPGSGGWYGGGFGGGGSFGGGFSGGGGSFGGGGASGRW